MRELLLWSSKRKHNAFVTTVNTEHDESSNVCPQNQTLAVLHCFGLWILQFFLTDFFIKTPEFIWLRCKQKH